MTRPAEFGILRGITREVVMDLARRNDLRLEERTFTVSEAKAAREAFQTSASGLVMPVVRIDGELVGDGKPGGIALGLRQAYHTAAEISSPGALLT